MGYYLADYGACLIAYVAFPVDQQFAEKTHGHQFLLFGHVSGIFTEDRYIGPEVFPLLFAPGSFQKAGKGFLIVEFVHQVYIVFYGKIFQFLDHLAAAKQGIIFFAGRLWDVRGFCRRLWQIHIYPKVYDIVSKSLSLLYTRR